MTRYRAYLLALLRPDDLFVSGKLEALRHRQSAKYYKQVVGGPVSGRLPRAAIIDADHGLEADGVDGCPGLCWRRRRWHTCDCR